MSKEILDTHYKRLAKDYDEFLCYSPEFVRALTKKMIGKLRLEEDDIFVDLGCGTGMYSLDILRQVRLNNQILGVDPYPEMLAGIPDDSCIEPVQLDALGFSRKPGKFDKILSKEAIHHIHERDELFANLFGRLKPGGILLLVHVPPDVQYPLFEKALERCRQWHANPSELEEQLKNAGFTVEYDRLSYIHRIPKNNYFKMVECCYMSALTSLSKEDMINGLIEMEKKYKNLAILEFVDHFDYLTATKKP
ncbi:MAG: class I SAM-dependent methyltransferase [Nitrospinota bacterium]